VKPFTAFTSTVAQLLVRDIDTDQIIPARFLKTTSKEGLGSELFYDWRYDASGAPKPEFILNTPRGKEAQILLAGDNFGCGSSREHAVWALAQFGFRAVISTSFADIFRQNALKNGLLPIAVSPEAHAKLCALPVGARLGVDLAAQHVDLPGGETIPFAVDPFARTCLLDGVDELGWILKHVADIAAYEASHQHSPDATGEP
jgi:3-isopropylmalate/(R)-2-methylmalate dehydratase small subunit